MNEQLVNRIRQCPTLPSLPAVAIQVLDLAQKQAADIAEIAQVITKDPALSSKILRTVNSSFYGHSQSVSTITHALVILGLQSVKTLVLGFSLLSNLTKPRSNGFKHLTYWRRSVYAATAARTIAAKLTLLQQEECFLAALLMDIGMLVLDQVLGDKYGQISESVTSHPQLSALEADALGMTHAEVAGILAQQWHLPPLLSAPMTFHHRPSEVQDPSLRKLTEVVHIASRCADVFVDEHAADAITQVRAWCLEKYRIQQPDCDAMLDQICKRTKEVASLFEISIASTTSYEAVLKKANEALVEITLTTQQQASSLQAQNQQLKQQVTIDHLTQLANRGRFDQFLDEQFHLALQQRTPLALVIMDMDKFKSVNDRFGHQAGDQVLQAMGALLQTAQRAHDLAARYGGEEFALVLPQTTRTTAAAIAESIRRAIMARPVQCASLKLAVTISLGVAVFEPDGLLQQPQHLIKAADLALYAAKHAGRNCVRVFSAKSNTPQPHAA